VTVITSLQNERVKLIRALQTSGKSRRKENRLVLEGVRLIGDALASGFKPDFVFYTASDSNLTTANAIAGDQQGSRLFASLLETLYAQNVAAIEVTPEVMQHVSETESPQGIIAVVPIPELPVPDTDLVLILDGIADPGNLGTILRTSAASGVGVVVLAPRCVDPYNPKVLRSGMGAHFRIPVLRKSWREIEADYGTMQTTLADSDGTIAHYDVDWKQPSVVIIGGEANGADDSAKAFAKTVVSIPMAGTTESLNASVAAGVILFEIRRQRTTNTR
jgi:TrmH family RNA methyltransferase